MSDVVETQVAAPAKKTVAKKAAKGKPAKAKAKVKPAKAKAGGDRITQEERTSRILKFLAKQKGPVTRAQIVAGTGIKDGINKTCNKVLGPSKIKREDAKFHDMGRGAVFTITAGGKAMAAKL